MQIGMASELNAVMLTVSVDVAPRSYLHRWMNIYYLRRHVQVAVDECTYEYLCMNCGTVDAIRLLLAVGTVSDERTDGLVADGQAGAMFRKGRWRSVVSVSEGREGKKVR